VELYVINYLLRVQFWPEHAIRRKLRNPFLYEKKQRRKACELDKNKNTNRRKKKNNTEDFHAFFQAIIPIIQEIWTDRCIDRNTPVVGGRIVAEYDSNSLRK
jgi:hypothetical protein